MTLTGTFIFEDGSRKAGSFEPDAASVEVLARQVAGVSRPMNREQFASHVGRSLRTVDGWLAAGMPKTKIKGVVMIEAECAMHWLKGRAA
jgi:hypothetical protein